MDIRWRDAVKVKPKIRERVLVVVDGKIHIGKLEHIGQYDLWYIEGGARPGKVTHWMPLMESP